MKSSVRATVEVPYQYPKIVDGGDDGSIDRSIASFLFWASWLETVVKTKKFRDVRGHCGEFPTLPPCRSAKKSRL